MEVLEEYRIAMPKFYVSWLGAAKEHIIGCVFE
jgi:hypothetical protein